MLKNNTKLCVLQSHAAMNRNSRNSISFDYDYMCKHNPLHPHGHSNFEVMKVEKKDLPHLYPLVGRCCFVGGPTDWGWRWLKGILQNDYHHIRFFTLCQDLKHRFQCCWSQQGRGGKCWEAAMAALFGKYRMDRFTQIISLLCEVWYELLCWMSFEYIWGLLEAPGVPDKVADEAWWSLTLRLQPGRQKGERIWLEEGARIDVAWFCHLFWNFDGPEKMAYTKKTHSRSHWLLVVLSLVYPLSSFKALEIEGIEEERRLWVPWFC